MNLLSFLNGLHLEFQFRLLVSSFYFYDFQASFQVNKDLSRGRDLIGFYVQLHFEVWTYEFCSACLHMGASEGALVACTVPSLFFVFAMIHPFHVFLLLLLSRLLWSKI